MAKVIKVELSEKSIGEAIKQVEAYRNGIDRKLDILCNRLASMGATKVSKGYASAKYDGRKDISVSVEKRQKGYAIVANGESVLFVEFGAGVRYLDNPKHPNDLGYHPGTYLGKGHWDDPKGWWIPKDQGGGHTYGNPASMTMYRTEQELEQALLAVAQEVFRVG